MILFRRWASIAGKTGKKDKKYRKKMLTKTEMAVILSEQNKEGHASASPPASAKRSTSS
jgi:hypothetical protein